MPQLQQIDDTLSFIVMAEPDILVYLLLKYKTEITSYDLRRHLCVFTAFAARNLTLERPKFFLRNTKGVN